MANRIHGAGKFTLVMAAWVFLNACYLAVRLLSSRTPEQQNGQGNEARQLNLQSIR